MKSGLEGRNNIAQQLLPGLANYVSMKSGLEGRNNGRDGHLFLAGQAESQ